MLGPGGLGPSGQQPVRRIAFVPALNADVAAPEPGVELIPLNDEPEQASTLDACGAR
jgi:hypothetical protein